jgi:hypothetical protein
MKKAITELKEEGMLGDLKEDGRKTAKAHNRP